MTLKPNPAPRLALAVCCLWLCAGSGPTVYRYSRQIDTSKITKEEMVAALLDSEVYATIADSRGDLRVRDENNVEISYRLEKVTKQHEVKSRESRPAKTLSLEPIGGEGGGVEIRISRDKKQPVADGLTITTPLTNYRQRVRVFGRSGEEWKPLVTDGLVFDYSRYIDVSNRDVPLPKNDYLEFRIVIDDVTAEQESQLLELTKTIRAGQEEQRTEKVAIARRPFRIDRIEFWTNIVREEQGGDRATHYPLSQFTVKQDSKARVTRITVDSRREPLTALVLETTSRNFSRLAAVSISETRGVVTESRQIGSATIDRVDFRDLQREHLRIEFPETRQEKYEIVIRNGDSPPLDVTGVVAEGPEYRAVFFATPGHAYRLAYGSVNADPPRFDTEALSAARNKGYVPVDVPLGPVVAHPEADIGEAARQNLLNNPVLLGVAIAALVAALGLGLYRASQRIDSLPKE